MTELTEHAKSILRAIADGKQIQTLNLETRNYFVISTISALGYVGQGYASDLRIAPETRSINGVVFAAPTTEEIESPAYELRVNDKYFQFEKYEEGYKAAAAIIDALEGRTKS